MTVEELSEGRALAAARTLPELVVARHGHLELLMSARLYEFHHRRCERGGPRRSRCSPSDDRIRAS
jgi:hypothetical protein